MESSMVAVGSAPTGRDSLDYDKMKALRHSCEVVPQTELLITKLL